MRLNALSSTLFLDKSTASRVVQALIRKGYVRNQRDALDGRAMALSVTTAGRRLHDKIVAELVRQQEELLADLTPEVRHAVVDVIRRLASAADARFRAGVSTTCCGSTHC
jgi:DNA-binding MarR family transcriptional regulator